MNPCSYTQGTSAWSGLKSYPKEVGMSKQREPGDAIGFLGFEEGSKSQPKWRHIHPIYDTAG